MSDVLTMKVRIEDWNEDLVEVPLFQLIQWKHAISLEMKGLTNSRGSVYSHVRKLLKAPRSFTKADMHNYLSQCIESINEQLGVAA